MKHAIDLDGKPHKTIRYIEDGGHAGWRRVVFQDGSTSGGSVCATELVKRYECDPFRNVNPFRI